MALRIRPPRQLIDETGRYEIIPNVESFYIEPVRPNSEDQLRAVKDYGRILRIWVVPKSYALASQRRDELIKEGHHPSRIELRYDWRRVYAALEEGNFEVREIRPLKSE